MSPLKLGVIGAGRLGGFHTRLAGDLPGAELVGVADPDRAALARVAEQFNVATFTDYRELAEEIDAAIVAAPTPLHAEIGLELIDRGIHVLMEKPLAATAAEASRLVRAADAKGTVLQVGHVERFNPALTAAGPNLIGAKYIEATRYTGYPFRSTDVSVVLDLMIHDLDIVLSLVGDANVAQVDALGICVLGHYEDSAQARIAFDNGCIANVAASRISYEQQRKMHVWTPEGFACVDFAGGEASVVSPTSIVAQRQFDESKFDAARKDHLKAHLFEEVLVRRSIPGESSNALADEQADFVGAIREARAPRVTGRQALRAIELAEMVLASIAAHQWDGDSTGRIGSMASEQNAIIRPPQWDSLASDSHRREAG